MLSQNYTFFSFDGKNFEHQTLFQKNDEFSRDGGEKIIILLPLKIKKN